MLYQQISIIDGSTFELYLNNMKPLLGLMVRNSELIIMNRCDGMSDENITRYRRGLKALNPQAQLIFEDAEGEIEQELLEEDLPYDMKADVIEIKPEDYGIWYIDALDKEDRYKGKVVEFTGMVLKSPEFPKNYFVPGRILEGLRRRRPGALRRERGTGAGDRGDRSVLTYKNSPLCISVYRGDKGGNFMPFYKDL